jgi:hypothetical protein
MHLKLIRVEKKVIFKSSDWVWVHIRKVRFHECRRSKLMLGGDDPFPILKRINDNVYKIDISNKYGISTNFDVFYLSLFDVGDDSRSNLFDERGNDAIQITPNDPLEIPVWPITRARAKKLKDIFNGFI